MSRTLNLAESLLARGRNYHELGRPAEAVAVFKRLARLAELPPTIAEETQVRLAEIHLSRRHFHGARRRLTAALLYHPQNARYHYLMASALVADPKADRYRAAESYRQSLSLNPNQPTCLSEFGQLALQLGQTEEGLTNLARAAELAPNDPMIIERYATALHQEGKVTEAAAVLRAALFRNARDSRFRRLWNNFQFQQLRDQQAAGRRAERQQRADAEGPVLLPFIRLAPGTTPVRSGRRAIRHDAPTKPLSPHRGWPTSVPNQGHG